MAAGFFSFGLWRPITGRNPNHVNRSHRSVGKLKSLNADPNHLAHGHFDQNPFDGSYSLVLAARTRDYPVSRILALAAELAQIADQFRHAEILYDFDDLTDAGAK